MILLQEKKKSPPSPCHYLPHKLWQFDYFFASELDARELGILLEKGWRKFGYYYFRPACPDCRECIPLRVLVNDYKTTKSQKRIINKNQNLLVQFRPLHYSERIYDIYINHSFNRFGKDDGNPNDFISSFLTESCPSFQSEYYLNDWLIAVGFIDQAMDGLSSVYFIYDTEFGHLGLGSYSIIREINHALDLGLPYYYLGYYIKECDKMAYKKRFRPYECFNWEKGCWSLSPSK